MMRKSVSLITALSMALPTIIVTATPATAHDGNRYGYERDEARYDNGPREWRGSDGRTYCRRSDGTVGLIVGGAGGALIGRALDGGRSRATGTILGAAAGALLGREVARKRRCR